MSGRRPTARRPAVPKGLTVVLNQPGKPLELETLPTPEVEPGGILIKNTAAAICGSDLHYWRAPVVEVRSTDGSGGVLDEDAAWLDLRGRQGLELERLSRLVEDDGQSLRHGWPPGCRSAAGHGAARPYPNRCHADRRSSVIDVRVGWFTLDAVY